MPSKYLWCRPSVVKAVRVIQGIGKVRQPSFSQGYQETVGRTEAEAGVIMSLGIFLRSANKHLVCTHSVPGAADKQIEGKVTDHFLPSKKT